MSSTHCNFRLRRRLVCALLLVSPTAYAQSGAPSGSDSQPELAAKIELLTKSLQQTHTELVESRAEIQQLRAALQEVLSKMNKLAAAPAVPVDASAENTAGLHVPEAGIKPDENRVPAQISQDDWEILNARLEEQRQTKVESASKYRLKLSGIALLNAFSTWGRTNNIDVPGIAEHQAPGYSSNSVGASVRQSIFGLTGYGPEILGART